MKQLRAALSLAALLVFLSTPFTKAEEDFKIEQTAAEDGNSQYHMQVPQDMATDFLNNLLPSLDEPTQLARGRELAQQWEQFNAYFTGTGNTSPGNLPTYIGRAPGPCPLASAGHTEKCKARACDMSPAVRAIKLEFLFWNKRVDEYLELNNCNQYPGTVWVYDLDAGNLRMGGIYLDLVQQGGVDDIAPVSAPWVTDVNSPFKSETKFFNQFRMTFTLSEVQLDADLRIDIENLRMKSPIGLTLSKHNVGVTLKRADQTISSSQHAISFRSILHFRANKACKPMNPPTPGVSPTAYDTTCVYRSDKITPNRAAYYRATRTESFLEGVVYDVNLPRVGGANTNPTAQYDASACQFDFTNQYATNSPNSAKTLNLGMKLDIGEMCKVLGVDICRPVLNWILNLIVGFILQGILCQMFNQLFFLMNAAGSAPTEEPGLINIGVQNLYNFFKKYVEKPLSTKEDAEYAEDVTVPGMFGAAGYTWPRANCDVTGYCPYPDAVDFNTSGIFKSISLGLNSILGNVSTTAGYTDKLVIVEVIDILTGNKQGNLPIGICPPGNTGSCTLGYCAGTCDGDIKQELMLADYPRVSWTGQPMFDGQIQLNGLLFKHVNSIKQLNLLDNGFVDATTTNAEYTHTLKNSIVMQRFGIQMKLVITLTDGTWIHRPKLQVVSPANKRSIYMNSDIYVELKDITINADIFMLLGGGRLGDKYIGSIFGNMTKGSFTKRLRCAAYGLDFVQIPRLQLTATLDKLEFTEFLGDLGAVITQGTKVFDYGYRTATNLYLKFLADNWVRPMINDYLKNNTYDGPCGTRNPYITPSTPNANCTRPQSKDQCLTDYKYYFAGNDPNRYINFYNSKVWNVVKGVVNDLVGGIPVRTGSASINQLIDVYLEMYIPVLVNNNVSVIKVPNNQAGKEMGNLDFPGNVIEIRSNKSTDNFFRLSQFTVRNIETIHELSVYPTQPSQPREFSVYFKLGGGKIWDRTNNQYITNGNLFFRFHLATEVTVPVAGVIKTYAEDQADFALEFGNVTLNANIYALLNQNDVLDLRFGDINKLGCMLSLVDEFELRQLLIAFQSFKFNIGRTEQWRHRTAARCNGKAWNVNNNNPNFESTIEMMVTDCHPSRIVRFSDSLDYLAWETLWWGAKVNNMLKYIFNGVSAAAKKTVNAFTVWNPPTIGCANHKVGGGGFISDLINSTQNATNEAGEAVTFWSQLTADQLNPRFPAYPKGSCSAGLVECRINYGDIAQANAQVGLPANSAAQSLASCQALPNGNKPGACWETRVEDDENRVDMRDNFVVREVQKFVKGSGQKLVVDALNALATSGASNLTNVLKSYQNGTMLPDGRGRCNNIINGEASYCIDIDADLELLGVKGFSNSDYIPGLEVAAKRLRVLNLHTFDANPESFNLLFNYIPDQYRAPVPEFKHAMYTLAHRIMFGSQTHGYLDVNVDVEVTVAREFLDFSVFNTTAGKQRVTDNINLGFKFADFDLQIMSTTAFNASRILEVPFYYMLDPMSPERCLFSIFYKNGLYLPQLQLQIADLIGPEVTISPKTPNLEAPTQANIFSKGVGYLITSTIEILFQLTKSDIPDMTQGPLRDYVNRVLDDLVEKSRSQSGPGSCPQPASCGAPNSMCHYQKFNDSSFAKVLDIVNGNIGGDPVQTSILDVNSLVNMGMKYAALDPNGPLLLGSHVDAVSNPEVGTWFINSLFDFTSGPSTISIKNVGIKGLDSIYKLKLDTFSQAPYKLGLEVEIGNGTMLDGSKIVPEPFQAEPLTLQLEVDMVVVAQRPGATPQAPKILETLADNAFRVELRFAGINIASFQQVLANRTDLFQLSITQVTKTQCMMAFIDKVTLETFSVQIADFDVHIPENFGRNEPDACHGDYCKIGKAMELIRLEAAQTNAFAPPQSSRPLSMLNLILGNVGALAENAVNTATIFNQTLYKCEVQKVVFQITSGVYTRNDSETLINHLLRNVTGILANPRPKITSDFTAITVQSTRADKPTTKTQFVNEVITSAKYTFGTGARDRTVQLTIGSVCDTLKMSAAFRPVCNMALGDKTLAANLSNTLAGWTSGNYLNYIDAKVPPSYFESDVVIDYEKDTYYDVRTSAIARGVSSYFSKSVEALEDLLKVTANKTDILRIEQDGTVTLAANITELMLMADDMIFSGKTCEGEEKEAAFKFADFLVENNDIIPHLRLLPGLLEIRNFGSFSEITLFKPYEIGPNPEDKARFTTQQQFGWRRPGQPMNISVNLDVFYDAGLADPQLGFDTGLIGKESIEINLAIVDLYVQVLALLAVNTTALGDVRLGDFLNVDAAQKFLRNCNAMTCLMTGLFYGGVSIPQLSINVTDVIGPTFTTTRNLFSPGMEAFIDAMMEMGVQLFRDDLTSLTQGPLRQTINNKLSKMLGDAKVPGACPERRNYTRDYPYGPNFCSHNDTTGVSPLLTHTPEDCARKQRALNGPTCYWSPPDVAQLDETTVACFYTKASKDLNFENAVALTDLKNMVNSSLLNPDSALYINNVLGAFASGLQTEMFQLDELPLKYNGGSYGTATMGIGNFKISGLDTVDTLSIFDNAPYAPGGDSSFENGPEYEALIPARRMLEGRGRDLAEASSFGYLDNKFTTRSAIGFTGPFTLSMRLYLEFTDLFEPSTEMDPDQAVINDITLSLTLYDFDLAIDLFMLVNIPRLMDLQVRSIGTIYELPCILEIFEDNGLIPVQFNMTYGNVGYSFCATPASDGGTGRVDSPMLSALRLTCLTEATSAELADTVARQLQSMTDYAIRMLASSELQNFLNTQISTANTQCTAIKTGDLTLPDFDSEKRPHDDAASAMGIVGLSLIFATGVVFALLVPVHFRRRDELMKRALLDAHERGAQGKSKDEFELAERRLRPVFFHPAMPFVVRYGVLLAIAFNIGCFASANFAAVGCRVELKLSLAGSTTKPIILLAFGLATSINDMWNSGAYPLAMIIALASGAWPYAKQILLLFSWFAPSTILHPLSRGRLLEILDSLGKFSMIDIYVLLIMMVAFRFYITSTMVGGLTLLPPSVVEVDVLVTADWGMYGFCLGAMGSLLVNHVMIWYNRKAIRADEDFQDAILGTLVKDLRTPRIPLSKHRFNVLDAEGRPYRFSPVVRIFVVFSLAVTFVMMIVACVLPTIKFTFRGVAGIAFNLIDPALGSNTQSAMSIGVSIINGVRQDAQSIIGVIFLQILYILFSLVLPLALIIVLLVIWLVPLTLREQTLLYFLAEVLSAWEASIVLLITFVAAVLQISVLASFIVDSATYGLCGGIEGQLAKIFPDPLDAKCFDVVVELTEECGTLWFACISMIIFCGFAFRLIEAAIHDRELAMRRKPPHSPGQMTGCQGVYVRRSLEAFGPSQIQDGIAGNVANAFAQNRGAFDNTNSMQVQNPVMAQEQYGGYGSRAQSSNPMFSAGNSIKVSHPSIDV